MSSFYISSTQCFNNSNMKENNMELLQSQAPVERELLGSSVIRKLEYGNTYIGVWKLVLIAEEWKHETDSTVSQDDSINLVHS